MAQWTSLRVANEWWLTESFALSLPTACGYGRCRHVLLCGSDRHFLDHVPRGAKHQFGGGGGLPPTRIRIDSSR
jgi:hypothetical protein